MDSWQMECCGEPFQVGSQVSWTIGTDDMQWLSALLGPGAGVTVDAFEDHHAEFPDGTPATAGTVTGISAVYCRHAPRPGDEWTRYEVDGSGVLVPLTRAQRFQPDRGGLQFVGYLVQLSVTQR